MLLQVLTMLDPISVIVLCAVSLFVYVQVRGHGQAQCATSALQQGNSQQLETNMDLRDEEVITFFCSQ
jgi:hypothetical protein